MLKESEFKNKLINKLNSFYDGWRDGDLDTTQGMKVDIINDNLKIAIEIKDDTKYRFGDSASTNLHIKGRQFKDDVKQGDKKFINYPDYQTLLIIRTDIDKKVIEYVLGGCHAFGSINGQQQYTGRPSTFWGCHDNSINEVGALLFWGKKSLYFRPNDNPNANKNRVITLEHIKNIMDLNL